jgi:hypothetical protein
VVVNVLYPVPRSRPTKLLPSATCTFFYCILPSSVVIIFISGVRGEESVVLLDIELHGALFSTTNKYQYKYGRQYIM